MEFDKKSTICEQLQPVLDSLPDKLRAEKIRQGMTNQQLSDASGIPIATVNRILTGAVTNPGIFYAASLCAALGLSLDELLGIAHQPDGDSAKIEKMQETLDHKSELLGERQQAVDLLRERSAMMEREIQTLNAQIAETRRTWKPLLYGLCGLCILLTVVWGVYVVLDAQQPEIGLIRSGAVSPIVWIGAAGVVIMLIMLLHFTVSRLYRKIR